MLQLKIKSYFVKLRNKTCGTTRSKIERFYLNVCLFFTLSTRKIGNRLSLQKIKFTFPLTFVLIVSAGRPLFDSQQLAFLVVEWVGKNTHYSLPYPLALFLPAPLRGSPPQSERLQTFTFTLYIWDDGTRQSLKKN